MAYKNIKSEYIRQKLRKTKWKDSEYIDDLIRLEDCIVNGVQGFAHAMAYSGLKDKYREEWEAIYMELEPERGRIIIERQRKQEEKWKKEEEEYEKKRKKKLEEMLKDWEEMGGQP